MTLLDRVGAAPISWGICEAPGWGPQLPVDRVLGEARELGVRAFEQGAIGWLPTDPAAQAAKLGEYDIHLLGGFVPMVLHDPARRDAALADADRIAAAMAAAGADYFVTAPVPALDDWHRPDLGETAWTELLGNLDRITTICDRHGLVQAVHPHVNTDIELAADVERLLDGSSAGVCFDTGHLTIGGVDVVEFARDHLDRISVVHLKDVDADIAARLRAGHIDLTEATRQGLFPPLGDGAVPIGDVVEALESQGYRGWYVMETDVMLTEPSPSPGEGPMLGVERSLAYLRRLADQEVGV